MRFYRFKTRSSYFFPIAGKQGEFIYSLYGNYGGKITKVYWWLFKNCAPFRWLHIKDETAIDSIKTIKELVGDDFVYGINMGTPGPEQKKSILGYNKHTGAKFFAKFATKEAAMRLSKNEIKVYETLSESGMVPKLYDQKVTDEYVYLNCECVDGEHVNSFLDEEELLSLLNTLRGYHYDKNKKNKDGLQTCFAHNDFCLWNMLKVEEETRLIDWEMADEFPLGHDLFTYIFQTTFFVRNDISTYEVYEKNLPLIKKYFGDMDYLPYLKSFVEYKVNFFSDGHNPYGLKRYNELYDLIINR